MQQNGLTYSDIVKSGYIKEIQKYNDAHVYELNDVIKKLQLCYNDYLGKSGNRKLKKNDISLYKSVMHYTEKYKEFYSEDRLPFSCRILLFGLFNNEPPREVFCKCGKKLCFIKQTQTFAYNSVCKNCKISINSKEWFAHRYGDDWEQKYNEYHSSEHMQKIHSMRGRLAIQKRRERGDIGLICKGKHEKKILDYFEAMNNIKIDRSFKVAGFYPDGYCHETNTIYEVYEPYHAYRIDKDKIRQSIIMDKLNCRFVIIHHDKNFDINNIKVEEYGAK